MKHSRVKKTMLANLKFNDADPTWQPAWQLLFLELFRSLSEYLAPSDLASPRDSYSNEASPLKRGA